MFIKNLDHFVLTVNDIEKTCQFYHHVLGLESIHFGNDRRGLKVGQQKVNLHQSGRELLPCAAHPLPGSADLCFITENPISEVIAHLEGCQVMIELGPVKRTGVNGPMTSIYIRDPDGNLIEISNYT